jgi:hypothetical protein
MSQKIGQKTYFCPYSNSKVRSVGARNCNNLLSFQTFECKYQSFCVAKEGLVEFENLTAQKTSLAINSCLENLAQMHHLAQQGKDSVEFEIRHQSGGVWIKTIYKFLTGNS